MNAGLMELLLGQPQPQQNIAPMMVNAVPASLPPSPEQAQQATLSNLLQSAGQVQMPQAQAQPVQPMGFWDKLTSPEGQAMLRQFNSVMSAAPNGEDPRNTVGRATNTMLRYQDLAKQQVKDDTEQAVKDAQTGRAADLAAQTAEVDLANKKTEAPYKEKKLKLELDKLEAEVATAPDIAATNKAKLKLAEWELELAKTYGPDEAKAKIAEIRARTASSSADAQGKQATLASGKAAFGTPEHYTAWLSKMGKNFQRPVDPEQPWGDQTFDQAAAIQAYQASADPLGKNKPTDAPVQDATSEGYWKSKYPNATPEQIQQAIAAAKKKQGK